MDRADIIESLKEATQRTVTERGFDLKLLYGQAADKILAMHQSFMINQVKPQMVDMALEAMKEVSSSKVHNREAIAEKLTNAGLTALLDAKISPLLPKSFVPVVFTTYSGETLHGKYIHRDECFIAGRWRILKKTKFKPWDVKGWHYT